MSIALSPNAPRILILDQDAAVRQALCFSLALDGYAVEPFGDPRSFTQRLDTEVVDAVIIGHAPPTIRGPQLVEQVRARNASTAVLMTATNPTTELSRAAQRDRVSLIEKPLLGDALLQALDAALSR
ncbi:response regulator [Caulobacter sp. RL271]|uniref:Response regulator n=1 Tax=Caulobacter segnis TaxID=88688 RepID=A0ABY4ZPL2_9CAUL|nr:response regulator [Caulobacter segnis]USQ94465.1 response regulator [Caulobacter segnis]